MPRIRSAKPWRRREKIKALENGADDYLTKPFSLGELLARMKVALRHARRSGETESEIFTQGDLSVDRAKRLVMLKDEEIHLLTQVHLVATLQQMILRFLAPDIIKSILDGTHPADWTVEKLFAINSTNWQDQRKALGLN